MLPLRSVTESRCTWVLTLCPSGRRCIARPPATTVLSVSFWWEAEGRWWPWQRVTAPLPPRNVTRMLSALRSARTFWEVRSARTPEHTHTHALWHWNDSWDDILKDKQVTVEVTVQTGRLLLSPGQWDALKYVAFMWFQVWRRPWVWKTAGCCMHCGATQLRRLMSWASKTETWSPSCRNLRAQTGGGPHSAAERALCQTTTLG